MRILGIAVLLGASLAVSAVEAKPSAETLINSAISDIDSHHALVTRVNIPAGLTLPKHYHPTEEFLYVASGSTILAIEGEREQLLTKGMAAKIPAKAVHTASTTDGAAEVIVFRIQPNGQPVRIPVKEQ